MKEKDILIDKRVVGAGSNVFVIAEIGINHGGDVNLAHKLIDAAVDCGADAVKFQSYRIDHLMIPASVRYAQQTDTAESAYQMLSRFELSWENQAKLKQHADEREILFLSTPFDEETADFLDSLGMPAFKVASSDITHVPLLRHIGSKGKPVLLSTGMSFLNEVADAVLNLRSSGAREILLLHCVSSYPSPPQSMNLRALQTLQSHFELPVGLSDHSKGLLVPLTAVALGAVVIEKHFTLDMNASGPDHAASMDPSGMKSMINGLKEVAVSLGDGRKRPATIEEEGRFLSRRSLIASVDIRAHETIVRAMLDFKRPGSGLEPRYLEKVIGMTARRNIGRNTILQWEDLAPPDSSALDLEDQNLEPGTSSVRTMPVKKRHA